MPLTAESAEPSHSLSTRSSLLFRLRNWEDAASWQEFYQLYQKLVFGLASRAGLNRVEAEEVTQDVFKRVAETIAEFESNPQRGSFRGWLMNLTRWRIADKFRERQRAARLAGPPHAGDNTNTGTRTIDRIPDQSPENTDAAWDAEWQRHVLEAALQRLKTRVPAQHFQAFDFYVRQDWSVAKVARTLEMSPATVYVISHRLKKLLKAEVEKVQRQLD